MPREAQVADPTFDPYGTAFRKGFSALYGIDPSARGPKPSVAEYIGQLGKVATAALGGRGGFGAPTLGKVRLFRGEGKLAPEGPLWRDPEMNKLSGQWFTTDFETAQKFAEEAKFRRLGPGKVTYVDVPEEVFQAARLVNRPEMQKFRYGVGEPGDVILTPEWAEKALPLPSVTPKRVPGVY